ncbi:hypothetical protein TNCV_4427981 [Trichonephila clavipes]|nr:hypothetical protein TNCV_4427981 [Trichonephila clavipes]
MVAEAKQFRHRAGGESASVESRVRVPIPLLTPFLVVAKHFIFVKTPTRGLLATDIVILSHDQVTRTTPELAEAYQRRKFELSTNLTCIASLHGGSLVVLASSNCDSKIRIFKS